MGPVSQETTGVPCPETCREKEREKEKEGKKERERERNIDKNASRVPDSCSSGDDVTDVKMR